MSTVPVSMVAAWSVPPSERGCAVGTTVGAMTSWPAPFTAAVGTCAVPGAGSAAAGSMGWAAVSAGAD